MAQETVPTWQSEIAKAVEILGSHAAFAKELGYDDRRNVWPWTSGDRMLPAEHCPPIERATKGACTCERLNDKTVWTRVPDKDWPHPKGRPLIDVAAKAPIEQGA